MAERPAADAVLGELAAVAADLGPALVPPGHGELLRAMTATAMAVFEAAACSIAVLDEDAGELEFRAASGAGAAEITGVRVPADRGIAGWVVSSGQPMAVREVTADPRFARDVAEATGFVPTSILAAPLETDEAVLGVIEVLDARGGGPAPVQDLELLGLFARQAALAVEGAAAVADLGSALFGAAAGATGGDRPDVAGALRAAATGAHGPRPELARLAAQLVELGRLGPDERRVAQQVVDVVLDYVRSRPGAG